MATASTGATTDRTPGQLYALVIGIVYLLVGVIGFFVVDDFTGGQDDDKLIIFRLNHLHNIVHLVLGVGWLAASRTAAMAKQVNMIFGVVLLLVAVLGFIVPDFMGDLLNIGGAGDSDNFLHLVTGALALYFATAGDRPTTTTTPTTTT